MIPKQGALLQKARESVRGAKLLADNGLFDFAASRAYYAMFYVAEAFLLGRGLAFSKHSAVHAAFGRYFVNTGDVPPHLHRYLLDAADARNTADYDVGPSFSSEDVSRLITHAEEFIAIGEQRIDSVSTDTDNAPPSPGTRT